MGFAGSRPIRFDVVLSFDIDRAEAIAELCKEIGDLYPDYTLQIVPDIDA